LPIQIGLVVVLGMASACAAPTAGRSAPAAQSTRAPAVTQPSATADLPGPAFPTAVTPAVPTPTPPASRGTDDLIAAAAPRTALALLGTLAVRGRAPKTGYSRAEFGAAWTDTDRNGCDTRDDILRRDLTGVTLRAGTHRCVVVAGTLAGPYTGRTISFAKSDASAVQVDHVVSLSDAWQTGAQSWPAAKRLAFANDPLDLLAVAGSANAAKSDSDAASWLPPNKGYRCAMVARQTAVKAKYGLWVKPAERDAIARVLAACPALLAPSGGGPTVAPLATAAARTSSPRPTQPGTAVAGPAPTTTYANCTAMHQAYPGGVARPGAVDHRASGGRAKYPPYYSQALYDANTKSDRDKDGVACEQ
jgi:hypothetical protein